MSILSTNEQYKVWKKTNGKCAYCGRELIMPEAPGADKLVPFQFSVDHVVPIAKGGQNNMDNLLPACRGCNSSKRHKTLEEYRNMLEWVDAGKFTEKQKAWLRQNGIELPNPPSIVFYFETIELETNAL